MILESWFMVFVDVAPKESATRARGFTYPRGSSASQGLARPSPVGTSTLAGPGLSGSETATMCLTCGFATRGEDEPALFRMPGKRAIGLRHPLPLGRLS
jgi:hypothetical protein